MFNDFDLISAEEMRDRQKGLKNKDEIVKKVINSIYRQIRNNSK